MFALEGDSSLSATLDPAPATILLHYLGLIVPDASSLSTKAEGQYVALKVLQTNGSLDNLPLL